MKVGIIRCQQTEDMCGGRTCLKVASAGLAAFQQIGKSEVIGFISCGGCPGKKAVLRAKNMIETGVEAIAFASCIFKGTPIGFSCPHADKIKEAISLKVGKDILILDYTH